MNRVLERERIDYPNQNAPETQYVDNQYSSMPENFAYEQDLRAREAASFQNQNIQNRNSNNNFDNYNNYQSKNLDYNYRQSLQNAKQVCAQNNANNNYIQESQPQFAYRNQQQNINNRNAFQNAQNNQNYGQNNFSNENSYGYENSQAIKSQQNYSVSKHDGKVNQKKGANSKVKLLIGVYFIIVAIIVSLLLVNALTAEKPVSASQDNLISYKEDVVNVGISEDGTTNVLEGAKNYGDYSFDEKTNWFDKMCDAIGSLFG